MSGPSLLFCIIIVIIKRAFRLKPKLVRLETITGAGEVSPFTPSISRKGEAKAIVQDRDQLSESIESCLAAIFTYQICLSTPSILNNIGSSSFKDQKIGCRYDSGD